MATPEFRERRYPDKAHERRFVFPVDETCFGRSARSVYGYVGKDARSMSE